MMERSKFCISAPDDFFARAYARVPRYTWITFISACVFGFITHLYMFANKLPNHDDVAHLFSATYGTQSGRWLLPTILRMDGDFSMPWLIGTLSVLMLAASACFVVAVLRIRSLPGCVVTAALMVTFPAVTATFSYMFTADAYFLSLALACAAAYLTVNYRWGFMGGIIAVALSMGIYQSYFSAAAALMVGGLLLEVLDNDRPAGKLILKGLKYVGTLAAGMLIYYIMVKITTRNMGLVDYMGISEMGKLSLAELPDRIGQAYTRIYEIFILNELHLPLGFLRYLFILAVLCTIGLVVFVLRRKKRTALNVLLTVALIVLFPLASNIIYVMVSVHVHMLMIYSVCFVPVLFIAVMEYSLPLMRNQKQELRGVLRSLCCWVIIIFTALSAYSFCIYDNKAYLKINLGYEQAYSYSTRLISAVERTDGYKPGMPLVLIGHASDYVNPDPTPQLDEVDLIGVLDMQFFLVNYTYGYFLKYYVGYGGQVYIGGSDISHTLAQTEDVAAMPVYPAVGSVRVIDGYAVIKLNS